MWYACLLNQDQGIHVSLRVDVNLSVITDNASH